MAGDELLQRKLAALHAELARHARVLVAFSGGVDSTFLLKVALDALGEHAFAITAVSPTMAQREIAEASALGQELALGDRHLIVASHELEREGFAANPVDRCALCKTELMSLAVPAAARLNATAIALGTNLDDLGDVRPGIAAASERGAIMPLVTAGFSKAEVRAASRLLGLRTWDKPQLACLSSRFPYGTQISVARLRQVDGFEDALRAFGFSQLRVRFHGEIARLELTSDDIARFADASLRERVVAAGKAYGFAYVALDLQGFRSGSLNETLPPALVQLARRGKGGRGASS